MYVYYSNYPTFSAKLRYFLFLSIYQCFILYILFDKHLDVYLKSVHTPRCMILLIKRLINTSLHQILPRKEICIIPGHESVLTTCEKVPDYFLNIA